MFLNRVAPFIPTGRCLQEYRHIFFSKLRDDSHGINREPYSPLSDAAGELGLLGVESRVSE